jgi:hypothetical protein
MPVLLSVPHDGRKVTVAGQRIMRLRGGIPGDRNVRYIASDICDGIEGTTGQRPSLIVDEIKRNRRWATSPYYDGHVIDRVAEIAEHHDASAQRPLFLDLHGFSNQPFFGEYDLILGTMHRASVKSDVDRLFGAFMSERGYNVYVPEEEPREGELFTAEPVHTLTHQVSLAVPAIDCMQVEIHHDFRTAEGRDRGVQLATDMADFIVEYDKTA